MAASSSLEMTPALAQHRGVRAGPGQVLGRQPPVEADGDVDRLHQLGGLAGEPAAPHGLSRRDGRAGGFGGRCRSYERRSRGGDGRKPKSGLLTWALWGAALVGVAAVVYIIGAVFHQAAPQAADRRRLAEARPVRREAGHAATTPTPAPDYAFYDAAGKAMSIADFKGKVVVMNIWATWCAPCKTEMPTLAKLQAAYAGKPVEVVAVSIDIAETRRPRPSLFIAQHAPLKFYHDREMKLPFALKPAAPGAPTTVIYGKDGLEVGRVAGEADWAGPEARAVIDKALAAS